MFILDTDHLVIIQQQSEPEFGRIVERMRGHSRGEFHVSIASFHEQVLGWTTYLGRAKSRESIVKTYARLGGILADFAALQVLPFHEAAAERFELLRHDGVRIGTMDLRIAATARSRDATVLTRNLVDFQKIPALRVEDWTSRTEKPR